MDRNYNKPTLRKVSGKESWYVFVTKPEPLRKNPNDKQVRKSTGTSDKRLAEKRTHSVAEAIYQEFDEQLKVDPFRAFVRQHWHLDPSTLDEQLDWPGGADPLHKDEVGDEADRRKLVVCELLCNRNGIFEEALADKLFQFLTPKEAKLWRFSVNHSLLMDANPYPISMQQQQTDDQIAKNALANLKSNQVVNKTGAPRLSEFVAEYQSDEIRWRGIRIKEAEAQINRLVRSIEVMGDIPVDQVLPNHGVMLAQQLDTEGKSNATIKAHVQSVRSLLRWVKDNRLNVYVAPPAPWITHNPFTDLDLSNYGNKKRNYEAFTVDQLHHLFSLEMPDQDRLLLSILITTGMRLDEAALLTWEQYKTDKNGLRYFDLSVGAIVKNDRFSARTVAIPDCLTLPPKGTGRLFKFKTDKDGKASREASKHLRQYTHAVRYNEADNRKVVHSLRHNLSGLLLNLRPTPSSEVMNWITGHGMEGGLTESERQRTYGQDPDVSVKYEIVNRVQHPWLQPKQ